MGVIRQSATKVAVGAGTVTDRLRRLLGEYAGMTSSQRTTDGAGLLPLVFPPERSNMLIYQLIVRYPVDEAPIEAKRNIQRLMLLQIRYLNCNAL